MLRVLAGLVAASWMLGCGANDLTESSGSGASSTASSASVGSGASGGGGGAGGGASGCSSGSICAPDVPAGWTGPAVIYVGTDPPKACDAPWLTAVTANLGALQAPFQCDACSCASPIGATCTAPTVSVYPGGGCSGTPNDTQVLVGGACAVFPGGYGAKAAPLAAGGGSCAPAGGAAMKNAPAWEKSALVCSSAPLGDACEAGHCVAAPAAPFAAAICVYKDGQEDCPAAFTNQTIVFQDVTDTRACSACACSAPAGASCINNVSLYNDAACTQVSIPPNLVIDGACQNSNYYVGMLFNPAATGGACSPSGGMPQGDVQPAAPVTICCTSP